MNDAITITDPGVEVLTEGQSFSLQLNVTNTAGGTLTYSDPGLPTGLTLNKVTGLVSGTIRARKSLDVTH